MECHLTLRNLLLCFPSVREQRLAVNILLSIYVGGGGGMGVGALG